MTDLFMCHKHDYAYLEECYICRLEAEVQKMALGAADDHEEIGALRTKLEAAEAVLAEQKKDQAEWAKQTQAWIDDAVEKYDAASARASRLAEALEGMIHAAERVSIFVNSREKIEQTTGRIWYEDQLALGVQALREYRESK